MKKEEQKIKKLAEELLLQLDIKGPVSVENKDDIDNVVIETDEAGILIGHHGETLDSLKLILTFLVSRELNEFTRINLDVSGYRKEREEKLKQMASDIKERVKSSGEAITIPNLTANDRRVIHVFLQEDTEVTTESQGEGEDRMLVIKPR